MELRKGNHCTYALTYHLVLVVKYRKPCIDDEIAALLKEKAAYILEQNKGHLVEANFDKDHMHILFELSPTMSLGKFVGVLKGVLSRHVRSTYPEKLSRYLYGNSFWSDSYFIASTGGVTIDILKKYVENQGKPKRKYAKKL